LFQEGEEGTRNRRTTRIKGKGEQEIRGKKKGEKGFSSREGVLGFKP